MRHLSTCVHSEAYIRLSESRSIIGTITSDSNCLPTVLNQTVNKHEFVVWERSGENFEFLGDRLEVLDILDDSLNFTIFSNIYFSSNLFSELFSSHADILLVFCVSKVSISDDMSLL